MAYFLFFSINFKKHIKIHSFPKFFTCMITENYKHIKTNGLPTVATNVPITYVPTTAYGWPASCIHSTTRYGRHDARQQGIPTNVANYSNRCHLPPLSTQWPYYCRPQHDRLGMLSVHPPLGHCLVLCRLLHSLPKHLRSLMPPLQETSR